MEGVYDPLRFRVLSNCQVGSGEVKLVIPQSDGDQWIDVSLDSNDTKLLGPRNMEYQGGWLVLELTPQDQATVPLPSVGQHITFVGPWVYDTENDWNAIYPVLWIASS